VRAATRILRSLLQAKTAALRQKRAAPDKQVSSTPNPQPHWTPAPCDYKELPTAGRKHQAGVGL